MTRAGMIERGADAVDDLARRYARRETDVMPDGRGCAAAVLDAVLPQVPTADELRRLPAGETLLGQAGERGPVLLRTLGDGDCSIGGLTYRAVDALHFFGPLVVWRP